MRISFDLDDTLICYQASVPRERPLPWYWRWIAGDEPLRRGSIDLMRRLRDAGWEIWIYTTSHRHPASVRWCYGATASAWFASSIKMCTMRLYGAPSTTIRRARIPKRSASICMSMI